MFPDLPSGVVALRLAVALGIGLLVGLERERRKDESPDVSAAGIRTFALVALLGGLSAMLPGIVVFAVAAAFVGGLAAVSYARSAQRDPGLTSEVALLTAFLLGGLALRDPALAAGIAVIVTALLAARGALHRFVRRVLTERELHDGLVLAAAALVILPLTPDRGFGPYDAFNPRTVWRLVVLVLAISALGYIAIRALGARAGLPLAGFAGGFVSSTATIGSLAARARSTPASRDEAAAGAVLSTVATIVQLGVVLGVMNVATLRVLALPLAAAALVALGYGASLAFGTARVRRRPPGPHDDEGSGGRAFDLRAALVFAAMVSVILLLTALLTARIGTGGLLLAAGFAGFADAHAAATSAASLVSAGRIEAPWGGYAVLIGLTTNTVSKIVVAVVAGTRRFALATVPGLALVTAAAWMGWFLARP